MRIRGKHHANEFGGGPLGVSVLNRVGGHAGLSSILIIIGRLNEACRLLVIDSLRMAMFTNIRTFYAVDLLTTQRMKSDNQIT